MVDEEYDPNYDLAFGYCPQCGAPVRWLSGDIGDEPGTERAWCPYCEEVVGVMESGEEEEE